MFKGLWREKTTGLRPINSHPPLPLPFHLLDIAFNLLDIVAHHQAHFLLLSVTVWFTVPVCVCVCVLLCVAYHQVRELVNGFAKALVLVADVIDHGALNAATRAAAASEQSAFDAAVPFLKASARKVTEVHVRSFVPAVSPPVFNGV